MELLKFIHAIVCLVVLARADSLRPRHPAARKPADRTIDARQAEPSHKAYYFDQLVLYYNEFVLI